MPLTATLAHDAMFYGSDDEFVAALVQFAREGLERDEAVVAAVTRTNIALLQNALGTDASALSFIDRDRWYRRPAITVVGWQRLLGDATDRGHRRMRLIGEVAFGTEQQHSTWTRYEAALNNVFARAPAWIVCPYDTRALAAPLLVDARRTHPATFHRSGVTTTGTSAPSSSCKRFPSRCRPSADHRRSSWTLTPGWHRPARRYQP